MMARGQAHIQGENSGGGTNAFHDRGGVDLTEQEALQEARRDGRAAAPPPHPLSPGGWHHSVIRRLQHHWSFEPVEEDELAAQLAEHTAGAAAGVPLPIALQHERADAPGPQAAQAPSGLGQPPRAGRSGDGIEASTSSLSHDTPTVPGHAMDEYARAHVRSSLRTLAREGPAALVMREYCAIASGNRARTSRLHASLARQDADAIAMVDSDTPIDSGVGRDGTTTVTASADSKGSGSAGAIRRKGVERMPSRATEADAIAHKAELCALECEQEAAALRTSSPMLPVGGLCMASRLLALGGGRMMLLCGDKAFAEADEMCGRALPHVATHGSFSFMANFHAVRLWTEALGGTALRTDYEDGFKCAAFIVSVGDPRA